MNTTRLRAHQRQIQRLQRRIARLQRISQQYGWIRLGIFVGGLAFSIIVLLPLSAWHFWGGLVGATLLFGLVVRRHRRVERSIDRHTTWQAFQTTQIARMQRDWTNLPAVARLEPRYEHPFEADLDLVGPRSLHHLIDISSSRAGSLRLRDWLTTPVPEMEQVRQRQQRIREFIRHRHFRERLILQARRATQTGEPWDVEQLLAWLNRPAPTAPLGWLLGLFSAFILLNLSLLVLATLGLLPPIWQGTLGVYLVLLLALTRVTGPVFAEATVLREALAQLLAVFRYLETYHYHDSPHLAALCTPFRDAAHRPSRHLAEITHVVTATGLRGNPFAWFCLNALLPWDIYFAYRLRQLKRNLVTQLPVWMEVWFELEAASALANLAYLNPGYTFPTFSSLAEQPEIPLLVGQELGHPLLPDQTKVRNDVTLSQPGELVLITGSNMAGKSTFLRTVGINLALAYAGSPVDATRLQIQLFRIFTCIKVSDSVTDGISYFYAEVRRLKALLIALQQPHPLPLFFCIDEIFRGTNNRERLIGSRAYIRALAGAQGIGMISTHDLDLIQLANELPLIRNYHFRDAVVDGRMVFDYRLRPGPCPTTNALTIMWTEGLPVPEPASDEAASPPAR